MNSPLKDELISKLIHWYRLVREISISIGFKCLILASCCSVKAGAFVMPFFYCVSCRPHISF